MMMMIQFGYLIAQDDSDVEQIEGTRLLSSE